MREVVGSIPAVPLFFLSFWHVLTLPNKFRPGVRTRVTGVVVVGVGAGLTSPQRSGDARPTSDGGLASPQPSGDRHMIRDDEASGRRRARRRPDLTAK